MDDIDKIEKKYLDAISSVSSLDDLDGIRVKGLGKKGEVTSLMKSIGSMDEIERRAKAPKLNSLKSKIIEELEKKKGLITEENINKRIVFL